MDPEQQKAILQYLMQAKQAASQGLGQLQGLGQQAMQGISGMFDYTPSSDQLAQMQAEVQRRTLEEERKRKMAEAQMREHINQVMMQQQAAQDAPQMAPPGATPPQGLISRTEGGPAGKINMSPQVLEALRQAGVEK